MQPHIFSFCDNFVLIPLLHYRVNSTKCMGLFFFFSPKSKEKIFFSYFSFIILLIVDSGDIPTLKSAAMLTYGKIFVEAMAGYDYTVST